METILKVVEILKGLSDDIVVALIAGMATVITLIYNKRKELIMKQVEIKEEKYIAFLSSFISYKTNFDTRQKLNETIQAIYLIGTPRVVKATNQYLELFVDKGGLDKEEQDKRYSAMVRAMRRDLYGIRSIRKYPDKLSLIAFQDLELDAQKIIENFFDKMLSTNPNLKVSLFCSNALIILLFSF